MTADAGLIWRDKPAQRWLDAFQGDAYLGLAAAVAEMLFQSHRGLLRLSLAATRLRPM